MKKTLSKYIGILIPILLTVFAYAIQKASGINVILTALILGIIAGNVLKLPEKFNAGIKFSSGLLLESAIVLLAFSIDYKSLSDLGWQVILILFLTVVFVLGLTIVLAKKFKCPGSTGWLVGFGTAICGSSAIASLAPMVAKDKSDIGLALAVVNILGLVGMIVLPYATKYWLNDVDMAILLGSSLHSVGNVAGAGFVVNEAVGEMAVTIKMGRVALLTPALLFFQLALGRGDGVERQKVKIPWYLTSFIVISILVSIVPMPSSLLIISKHGSTALLSIAMAAIGLKMNLSSIAKAGKKGLIFGSILFVSQLIFIGLLLWIF